MARTHHHWPTGADLPDIFLTPTEDERVCPGCTRRREICDHRFHRVETFDGPVRLVCRLLRCPDRSCSGAGRTFSPYAEGAIAPPRWIVDWKVFAWIGQRRFRRHWSIAQIGDELFQEHNIKLSDDVLEKYVARYERMVAARHQDPEQMRDAYADIKDVVLAIDGLQPEKGHEVLYVVRELNAGRIWFAAPLLSSTDAEINVLLERAKAIAATLDRPVRAWVSDKQAGFVSGIETVFPGVPHRFCKIHFVRALAKETYAMDSRTKAQMRRKVRGLRGIEQGIQAALQAPLPPTISPAPTVSPPAPSPLPAPPWATVVQDYCSATRGVLNDGQGTTLDPPGQRMARALEEIKVSIDECLDAKKGGPLPGR